MMVETKLHQLPASGVPQLLLSYLSLELGTVAVMQEMVEMVWMASVSMSGFPEYPNILSQNLAWWSME